jgi:hypothetical protein
MTLSLDTHQIERNSKCLSQKKNPAAVARGGMKSVGAFAGVSLRR